MFDLSFSAFATMYVSTGIALMLALWLYYDRRDQRLYERERAQSLFHCLKCGRLYSAPRFQQSSNCPGCGFENSKLKF